MVRAADEIPSVRGDEGALRFHQLFSPKAQSEKAADFYRQIL